MREKNVGLPDTEKNMFQALLEQEFPPDWRTRWADRHWLFWDNGGGCVSFAGVERFLFQELAKNNGDGKVKICALAPNEIDDKAIYSVVGYQYQYDEKRCPVGEPRVLVGNKADRNADVLVSNFKECPTNGNLNESIAEVLGKEKTRREIMVDMCRAAYRDMVAVKGNGIYGDRAKTMLVVAHPSGGEWNKKETLDNYRKILSEATSIPIEQILTIRESRAAIQYIGRERGIPLGLRLLIIDLGAYSVDVTYISRAGLRSWDYTIALGGKQIEINLAKQVLAKRGLAENQVDRFDRLLYRMRIVKETACDEKFNGVKPMDGTRVVTVRAKHSKEGVTEKITDAMLMDAIMKDTFSNDRLGQINQVTDTWTGHLEAFLDMLDREPDQIDHVLITGGTANVEPLCDVIKKHYHNKNSNIQVSTYCSKTDSNESVPIGCAYHMDSTFRVVLQMENFKRDVAAYAEKNFVDKLVECISDEIAKEQWEKGALVAAKEWADSIVNLSYSDLEQSAQNRANSVPISKAMNCGVKHAADKCSNALTELASNFYQNLYLNSKWKPKDSQLQQVCGSITKKVKGLNLRPDLEKRVKAQVKMVSRNYNGIFGLSDFIGDVADIPASAAATVFDGIISGITGKERITYGEFRELRENEKLFSSRWKHTREVAYKKLEAMNKYSLNTPEFKSTIRKELELECKKTKQFGLPEALVKEMCRQIEHAVYAG